jgi:hypothetical protein
LLVEVGYDNYYVFNMGSLCVYVCARERVRVREREREGEGERKSDR